MTRAVVIKYGDPSIAGAIENGIHAANQIPKPLNAQQAKIVSDEIDRQKMLPNLVRVANGNTNTPDDYAALIAKERYKRQKYERPAGFIRGVGKGIVDAWCLMWAGIFELYGYFSRWNRD